MHNPQLLHVLEPLGGEENLVLMCEAREFLYVSNSKAVWFKVNDLTIYSFTRLDTLFNRQVWSLRIDNGYRVIHNSDCITSFELVGRIFETYTSCRLWF